MSKPKNVVDIIEAKRWARKWQTECPDNCKAFLMPAIDLIETLKEMGVLEALGNTGNYALKDIENSGIRAYMAIDENIKEGGGEKLLIVGTKKDSKGKHRDIIQGAITDDSINILEAARRRIGSGVFDFTDPCPSECDPNSPLI